MASPMAASAAATVSTNKANTCPTRSPRWVENAMRLIFTAKRMSSIDIRMTMTIELILLAVNINLIAFSTHLGDLVGQVFALFVLTVAAAEAAIGLAILVVYFRNRGSIAVEDINLMKG